MKNLIILLLALAVAKLSLAQSSGSSEIEKLKETDIAFSNHSKEKGMKEAFLVYIDTSGVLLRPNNMPIEGIDNVRKYFESGNSDFTLTWLPLFAEVSSSLDLGYTYGTYELSFKDETGIQQTRNGTYVSIWKKQPDQSWKFVLDTGNPGLEHK